MKIKIAIGFILVTSFAFAQRIIALENEKSDGIKPDTYYKDINNNLNKFVGTWKWQNNATNPTRILEITFSKLEHQGIITGFTSDILLSKFRYIENGITVYDTYNDNSNYSYISGGFFSDINNLNKIKLFYSEPNAATAGYRYGFSIEVLPLELNGPIKLKWQNKIISEVAPVTESPKIPFEMILVKQ